MMRMLLLFLLAAAIAVGGEIKSPAVGAAVPSFSLKNYDGKPYELKSFLKQNKYTVLIFMSTQCPVSNAYNDRMEALATLYKPKGVQVVGINSNVEETVAAIAEHARDHGLTFPVLKDPGNSIADEYGAQVTPEAYVVGSDGTLLYHGRIDDSRNKAKVTSTDLASALDKLLAGGTIASSGRKAFGCSIKRAH